MTYLDFFKALKFKVERQGAEGLERATKTCCKEPKLKSEEQIGLFEPIHR
jgi:hypothetical protein